MNPNATQVGGTHYRSPFQHWDLVVRLKLGYFEGQITKYVTRHRSKNGKQDLDKALHFLLKLMVLAKESGWQPTHLFPTTGLMDEYAMANKLTRHEQDVISFVCSWSALEHLKLAEHALGQLFRAHYEPAPGLPWPERSSDEDRLARISGTAIDGDVFRSPAMVQSLQTPLFDDTDGSEPGRGYVDQGRDI